MSVILDAGHGMSNRRSGVFDPGFVSNGVREADVVMDWTNELRSILMAKGQKVVRTRVDHKDPAPVGQRAAIARKYGGRIMISFHCNAGGGTPNGTETYYRGKANFAKAKEINDTVVRVLQTRNRGAKTEGQSQHTTLAVLSFNPCFLIELGFLDNADDRKKMLDPTLRGKTCEALAELLV